MNPDIKKELQKNGPEQQSYPQIAGLVLEPSIACVWSDTTLEVKVVPTQPTLEATLESINLVPGDMVMTLRGPDVNPIKDWTRDRGIHFDQVSDMSLHNMRGSLSGQFLMDLYHAGQTLAENHAYHVHAYVLWKLGWLSKSTIKPIID